MDSAEAFDVTSLDVGGDRVDPVDLGLRGAHRRRRRRTAARDGWSVTSATSLVVALSVWASLASATARKETRIAQKTATRIPATSPPDTVCTRSRKDVPEHRESRSPSLSRRARAPYRIAVRARHGAMESREAIVRSEFGSVRSVFHARPRRDGIPHGNLPLELDAFVGRAAELAELAGAPAPDGW